MEDTLRYFFSAMFQGFAALIALGAIFYLYFKELSINRMSQIENELRKFLNVNNTLNIDAEIDSQGIQSYTDNYLNNHVQFNRRNTVVTLHSNYKSIKSKREEIETKLPTLLKNTITILIISLFSLFIIGYHEIINFILIPIGIFVIIFSVSNLIKMKNFILIILDKN